MLNKLQTIANRFEEINRMLALPEVLADRAQWTKLTKERAELEEIAAAYADYRRTEQEMNAAFAEAEKETGEMRELLSDEGYALKAALAEKETSSK